MKSLSALVILGLSLACGAPPESTIATGYHTSGPLTPAPPGSPTGLPTYPPGTVPGTEGAGSLANCTATCPGAVSVEFYAPFAYCRCDCHETLPNGDVLSGYVDVNLWSQQNLSDMKTLWLQACPHG